MEVNDTVESEIDEAEGDKEANGQNDSAESKTDADVDEGATAAKTADENATPANKEGTDAGPKADGEAVEETNEREQAMPSNILEKGIIYFFARGRVGVEDPDSVQDLARSFFVLRPLPEGAKLTDGAIQDVGNNRLVALPKKVWPKSGKDRFMAFVEKGKTSMETLKEDFFQGSEYNTKTM